MPVDPKAARTSADDGKNTATGQQSSDPASQNNLTDDKQPQPAAKESQPDDGTGNPGDDGQPQPAAQFTQEDLNRIIGERLSAERQRWQREQQEQHARQTGEWQQLAETYRAERDDFETRLQAAEEKVTSLTVTLRARVDEELKSLPEDVRDLAPAADDLAALVAWLSKARRFASDPVPAAPSSPKPAARSKSESIQEEKKTLRHRSGYGARF
ncbi:MAG: hypothetical protein U0Z53_29075 [Blastocatellia bacterium]